MSSIPHLQQISRITNSFREQVSRLDNIMSKISAQLACNQKSCIALFDVLHKLHILHQQAPLTKEEIAILLNEAIGNSDAVMFVIENIIEIDDLVQLIVTAAQNHNFMTLCAQYSRHLPSEYFSNTSPAPSSTISAQAPVRMQPSATTPTTTNRHVARSAIRPQVTSSNLNTDVLYMTNAQACGTINKILCYGIPNDVQKAIISQCKLPVPSIGTYDAPFPVGKETAELSSAILIYVDEKLIILTVNPTCNPTNTSNMLALNLHHLFFPHYYSSTNNQAITPQEVNITLLNVMIDGLNYAPLAINISIHEDKFSPNICSTFCQTKNDTFLASTPHTVRAMTTINCVTNHPYFGLKTGNPLDIEIIAVSFPVESDDFHKYKIACQQANIDSLAQLLAALPQNEYERVSAMLFAISDSTDDSKLLPLLWQQIEMVKRQDNDPVQDIKPRSSHTPITTTNLAPIQHAAPHILKPNETQYLLNIRDPRAWQQDELTLLVNIMDEARNKTYRLINRQQGCLLDSSFMFFIVKALINNRADSQFDHALQQAVANYEPPVMLLSTSDEQFNFEPLQLKLLDKTSYTDVSTVDATMNTYPAAKSSVAFISTHNQRSDISSASWQTITSKIHDSFPDGCIIRHGDRSAGHIVYYHPAIGVISGGIAASHAGNNFKPLVQYCIDSKWVDPTLIVMSFTDMQTMIDMLMG